MHYIVTCRRWCLQVMPPTGLSSQLGLLNLSNWEGNVWLSPAWRVSVVFVVRLQVLRNLFRKFLVLGSRRGNWINDELFTSFLLFLFSRNSVWWLGGWRSMAQLFITKQKLPPVEKLRWRIGRFYIWPDFTCIGNISRNWQHYPMFRQIISNEKEVIAFYDNSGNTGILPYIYLLLKLLPNISQ